MAGGTAEKLTNATIIVSGVAALIAALLSMVSIFLQAKNYRKPLLQRYVVRILLMVPIYSIASWTSMVSVVAAQVLDPIRDIYEAFTIYTFFQLLINYLDGERALIIMTHGREPVNHLWPMNHVLSRVDISDPHTFLAIKRGILQYAWLKPILGLATIILKATHTYHEGRFAASSGYLWIGILYNISVSLSLYSLGLFWVCMHQDLLPFRPVPKFLCIKLIIFASYWQGFFLSVLVWLGAIPSGVDGYSSDNLAAAIQDALICIEMPGFAIAHWYAFSWHDFADKSVSSARMPVWFAFRDAFGIRDLIEDSKQTFSGDQYGYRIFDSGDKIMAHEASDSRLGRLQEGMRYTQGGKAKYWIPTPGQVDRHANHEIDERDPLLAGNAGGPSNEEYNAANGTFEDSHVPDLDKEEEALYGKARELEFGDWNYPVITANEPLSERFMSSTSSFGISPPSSAAGRRKQKQANVEAAVVTSKKKRKQKPAPKSLVEDVPPKSLVDDVPPKSLVDDVPPKSLVDDVPPKSLVDDVPPKSLVDDVPPKSLVDDVPPKQQSFISGEGSSDSATVKDRGAEPLDMSPVMEERSPWENSDQEDNIDTRFRVGDDDEFQNVWNGGDQSR